MPNARTQPTSRQREYLSFIKSFTDRWGIPPSFEEIARHFQTSTPSVNGMVKTLEARGFLARVPGAARTLRVLVPDAELVAPAAAPGTARAAANATQAKTTAAVDGALTFATTAAERLIPVLAPNTDLALRAMDALREALAITLKAAGASNEQYSDAESALRRTVSNALGSRTELRPGRRLAWWQRPHR